MSTRIDGPWVWQKETGFVLDMSQDQPRIVVVGVWNEEEGRLIAAAPELLAVSKKLGLLRRATDGTMLRPGGPIVARLQLYDADDENMAWITLDEWDMKRLADVIEAGLIVVGAPPVEGTDHPSIKLRDTLRRAGKLETTA